MATLSDKLGQQLPPAWALSSGNLESIENQAKIQQDQYTMNGLLVKAGSAEATANAAATEYTAQQEAQGLQNSAIGQIVGSGTSLLATAGSTFFSLRAATNPETLKAGQELDNANKWDKAIKDVLKNPSQTPTFNAGNEMEMKNLHVSENNAYTNPFEGEDGSGAFNPEVPGQMSELLGEDKEAYFKLGDRISKNQERLEKAYSNAQSSFDKVEGRLNSLGQSLNGISQAAGNLAQAQNKQNEILSQGNQKYAEFLQNGISTAQGIITQAINATGNQESAIAQAINAEASANKVN